jgi:hypothetical protein
MLVSTAARTVGLKNSLEKIKRIAQARLRPPIATTKLFVAGVLEGSEFQGECFGVTGISAEENDLTKVVSYER